MNILPEPTLAVQKAYPYRYIIYYFRIKVKTNEKTNFVNLNCRFIAKLALGVPKSQKILKKSKNFSKNT